MARLFIGARELAFISDITKELTKDVSGQKIYYYRISAERTHTHSVYDEAVAKVFDPPIEIECLVGQPEYSTASTTFSVEMTSTIEAFVQRRDLLDKGIEVTVGDFFTYGEVLYEIAKVEPMRSIFGQVEHKDGVKLTGTYARQGQLSVKPHGPTEEGRSDADAVQDSCSSAAFWRCLAISASAAFTTRVSSAAYLRARSAIRSTRASFLINFFAFFIVASALITFLLMRAVAVFLDLAMVCSSWFVV
jgi:hypothetical protein